MKKTLIVLSIIVLLILSGIGLFNYYSSNMINSVNQFFTEVKSKNYDNAYLFLSKDFRESISQEELVLFLKNTSLSDFKEAFWNGRRLSLLSAEGELKGLFTTNSGDFIGIKLLLLREKGRWVIDSFQNPDVGLIFDSSDSEPNYDQQVLLVKESLRQLGWAIRAEDFTVFHKYISLMWQKQITPQILKEKFQPFIEDKSDFLLLALENYKPIFDQDSEIDDNKLLQIQGHYSIKPSRVDFKLAYIQEGYSWKLFSIKVSRSIPNDK